MRKLPLPVLIVFLFLHFDVNAQSACLPNGVQFTTQAEVNEFVDTYPDCTEILGNLIIGNGTENDISDLSAFKNIEVIHQSLIIRYGSELNNLEDLSNLREIKESLDLSNIGVADLSNLEIVGDKFYLKTLSENIHTNEFAKLREVGGDLFIWNNTRLKEISGLNNLETIGGDVQIYNNDSLTIIDGFDNLHSIGGDFRIYDNESLNQIEGFDNLTVVGLSTMINRNDALKNINVFNNLISSGGISIEDNDQLISIAGFEKLDSTGETIRIFNNKNLSSLIGFDNLRSIDVFVLQSCPQLSIIPSFDKLKQVTSAITLSGSNLITDLMGFDSLSMIDGSLNIGQMTALTKISGFKRLKSVESVAFIQNEAIQKIEFDSLIEVTEGIRLIKNPMLTDLDGFKNITSTISNELIISENHLLSNLSPLSNILGINRNLQIEKNASLSNLNFLSNITSSSLRVTINENPILNDISGLSQISPEALLAGISNLQIIITDNPQLQDCDIKSICQYLTKGGVKYRIKDNAQGCNNVDEFNCWKYGVRGVVYYDENENGEKDNNELGLPYQKIYFENFEEELITDKDGRFFHLSENGTPVKFSWKENEDWTLISDSSSYQFIYESSLHSIVSYDFGLSPNYTEERAEIVLTSTPTRCNTDVRFSLDFQNLGIDTLYSNVVLEYDKKTDFVSSSVLPDFNDLDNRELKWNMQSLPFLQTNQIQLDFMMPDEQSTGEELKFTARIESQENTNAKLDEVKYNPIVLCSYDPNDKLVNPNGILDQNLVLKNQKLTYTIRFQNTGNAEAIDIAIRDTIDQHLDMRTFKVVNSSHSLNTLIDDNFIVFRFANIWLPDSLSNEAESHGFVTYEIEMMPDLEDYTAIYNTAFIYFDFNPPIITNTVLSTAVDKLPTRTIEENRVLFSLYPNPASQEVNILIDPDYKSITILNCMGQVVYKGLEEKIDLSSFKSGLYTITVETFQSLGTQRLVIINE